MNNYEKWLRAEKEWIGEYCKKTRNQSLFLVTPLVLVGLAVLFAGMAALNGGGADAVIESAVSGLMLGIFICIIYLLIMLPNMNPGKYSKKIDKNVSRLGLTDPEKEQLGQEMLAADEGHKVSFKITGPNAKGTPARFVLTPHYAFLEGSSPYSILVRLSDIEEIRPSQEEKDAVRRGAKTVTYYKYTLYTIGFYKKGSAQNGYPDEAMGFLQEELRSRALELLQECGIPIKAE